MGLTVHFTIRCFDRSAHAARGLIEKLRRRAVKLPLERVSPVHSYQQRGPNYFHRLPAWFRMECELSKVQTGRRTVFPERAYAFEVWPGRGAEICTIGLVRYPRTITRADGRRIAVRPSGWYWHDFCKTQYASNPRYGGLDNFLRCHVALIELLDKARELGLRTKVHDEGKYAKNHDLAELEREVIYYNELVAGFVGRMKDIMQGGESVAPIMDYPNFEHLEARGAPKWP